MKRSIRTLSLSILFGATMSAVNAQQLHRCGTDEWHAEACKEHPEMKAREQQFNMQAAQPRKQLRSGMQIIPVVVHVLHATAWEAIPRALKITFRFTRPRPTAHSVCGSLLRACNRPILRCG
jgi:hypothetical protein